MDIISSNKSFLNDVFLIPNNWKNVLYIHTPFCETKCCYCIYSSKVPKSNSEVQYFLNNILNKQIEIHMPIFENIVFDEVYFGGGTPTILTPMELEGIFSSIPNFDKIPFKAIESSPVKLTPEHVDLLERYKFNYVSLGVQSTNKEILDKQNRSYVTPDKLAQLCQLLEKSNIISNIDLIFYLKTGNLNDLDYSEVDLNIIMNEVRPESITCHYNYLSLKSYNKRKAMIDLILRMLEENPNYKRVNSLLQSKDIEFDMHNASEYRLMRKNHDMLFYLTSKVPQSHNHGYNMLSLGEYERFKLRDNYYYLYDDEDYYNFKHIYKKYHDAYLNLSELRKELNLSYNSFENNFFKNQSDAKQFETIINKYNLPIVTV